MPEVTLPGPDGRLEGRYHPGPSDESPIALVLHPHPQYGGTMNNKVVYHLYYALHDLGFSVLRINFRGVGRSQGEFDNGIGELSDAAAALDYLQHLNPNARQCWIAGFSFGAWITMQLLMRRPEINGFVAVAPPANMYDFSFLAPCPSSGLILNGNADRVVPAEDIGRLTEKLKSQKNIVIDHRVLEGANHFFTDHMEEVVTNVRDYVGDRLIRPVQPVAALTMEPKDDDIDDDEEIDSDNDLIDGSSNIDDTGNIDDTDNTKTSEL